MFSKFKIKSELIRSALVLSSGTALAQGISYLITPLITRLYTPEDFGEFGMIMRVVALLAIIGAIRYEYALPLPKKDEHAFHLYRLTIRILIVTVVSSFLVGTVYWMFSDYSNKLLFYILLTVAITGFTVFINIGRHWAIRMKWFKRITVATLLTSSTTNFAKLLAGIASWGVAGLVISTLLGLMVGSLVFLKDALGIYKNKAFKKSDLRRRVLAKQYSEFPKVQLPHTVIDAMRELLVAFFLTIYFSTAVFGSYDHSFRMLKIPLLLIGSAIGQVLYNRISEDYAAKKPIYPLLKRSVLILTLIGILPFTVIYIWGAPIFTLVFGSQWTLSGEIAAALAPWLLANFVASSISMVPAIVGKLKWFFWVGLVTSGIQLLIFGFLPKIMDYLNVDEVGILAVVSWVMFGMFTLMTLWILKIVKTVSPA